MNIFANESGPQLAPYQSDLLTRSRTAYDPRRGVFRVVHQAACGFGKTWCAAEQTRRALTILPESDKIMHIVHRRRLVDQMTRTLSDFGIHSSALMQGRIRWDSRVICASRDTLLAMLKDGVELPIAKFLIWDECHTAAQLIQEYYLNRHPAAFWAGYTATPIRADGKSLAPPYQAMVCSITPCELIQLGRLCPVKVFNPDAVGRRRVKGDKVKPVGDPVAHWRKYGEDSPTVVFAATVKQSMDIVNSYRAAGITAEHIDASTSDNDRESVFERSESGQTKVISNVGVLVEGVDLPWLRCCQILRGCNSVVLWFQANGRIMRAFPGKDYGICLDHAGAAHEFGMPDGAFAWCLGDESAVIRANKQPKDRKPITCQQCGFVFSPRPACPECGRVLPRKRRSSLLGLDGDDGLLTQFNGQAAQIDNDRLTRAFKKAFFMVRAKGGRMCQVNAIFAREAGKPAWDFGLPLNLPCGHSQWQTPAKDWQL